MLYEHNTHAKSFQMATQWMNDCNVQILKLRLIYDRSTNWRIYNQLTVSEVSALILSNVGTIEEMNIIIQTKGEKLQIIDEIHASYLAYQCALTFPCREDDYRLNATHRDI